jgi:hypothetical protein
MSSSRQGIDESWRKLTPAEARAAGMEFVAGYVSQDTTGKNLTPAQVAAYRNAGIAIVLLYEYDPKAAADGFGGIARARADATVAIAGARALGAPLWTAIYAAVDYDVSPSDVGQIRDYVQTFSDDVRAAGYQCGVYGGLVAVQYCGNVIAPAPLLFQTYAWSGGVWDPRTDIHQVQNGVVIDGVTVDRDMSMVPNYGQWPPASPPVLVADVTVPLPVLHLGSTGIFVKRAQALCNVLGADLAVDGQFGPLTDAAVRRLQGAHRLGNSGVVDALTWAALLDLAS